MIISNYQRLENESDEELIYRITNDKDKIGSWSDVANIINKILGKNYTESKYRKQKQSFDKLFEANKKKFINGDSYLKEIEIRKRELEQEKIRYRDERNAWQKQNYIAARAEQKLDYLEDVIRDIGKINFPINDIIKQDGDSDMLIILSDLHIGQCFNSLWGEYNSNVAKDRLTLLLQKIIKLQESNCCKRCFVSIQGDLISGNIHKTIQVTNRENVIEQVKTSVGLISSFCHELTNHFNYVLMTNVSGNHSRIDKKEEALHDERLDDLIAWMVSICLEHIPNFSVLKRNLDSGIADISIRGKTYIAVHGDFDPYNKSGLANLVLFLGFHPYAVLYGHMHSCALSEVNGIKMIRGGSLSGSGDSFTIEKRLAGKPSQMVCICDETGVKSYHPIEL